MKLSILLLGTIIATFPAQARPTDPLIEESCLVKFTTQDEQLALEELNETLEQHSSQAEKRIIRLPNGTRLVRSLDSNDEILEQQLLKARRKVNVIQRSRAETNIFLRAPDENTPYNDVKFFLENRK